LENKIPGQLPRTSINRNLSVLLKPGIVPSISHQPSGLLVPWTIRSRQMATEDGDQTTIRWGIKQELSLTSSWIGSLKLYPSQQPEQSEVRYPELEKRFGQRHVGDFIR
jgi:hypothetical protein